MKKLLIVAIATLTTALLIGCAAPTSSESPTIDPTSAPTEATIEEPAQDPIEAPTEQAPQTLAIPNPMVEYETLNEVNEELGLGMFLPQGVSDTKFFIIDDAIAEAQYVYNGINISQRMTKSESSIDISGVSGDLEVNESLEAMINDQPYPFDAKYDEGGIGTANFYDSVEQVQYSLFVESEANADILAELVAIIAPVG